MTRSQHSMNTNTSDGRERVTLRIEGDDVVAYGRNAEIVSEVLGLTLMLARRDGRPAKLTGLKTILLDTYTIRLIDAGYYVRVDR